MGLLCPTWSHVRSGFISTKEQTFRLRPIAAAGQWVCFAPVADLKRGLHARRSRPPVQCRSVRSSPEHAAGKGV
jgi:hypothetical protein